VLCRSDEDASYVRDQLMPAVDAVLARSIRVGVSNSVAFHLQDESIQLSLISCTIFLADEICSVGMTSKEKICCC
jgi:hypothetical protein